MTKKELSRLRDLNREIAQEKIRIRELEAAATSTNARITGLPHVSEISNKTAIAVLIADSRAIIKAKVNLAVVEYNRLNRYIAGIEDSQMRQILSLRYVNGLSWQQVAFAIGEHDEQYPRRRHNDFLKHDENDEYNPLK